MSCEGDLNHRGVLPQPDSRDKKGRRNPQTRLLNITVIFGLTLTGCNRLGHTGPTYPWEDTFYDRSSQRVLPESDQPSTETAGLIRITPPPGEAFFPIITPTPARTLDFGPLESTQNGEDKSQNCYESENSDPISGKRATICIWDHLSPKVQPGSTECRIDPNIPVNAIGGTCTVINGQREEGGGHFVFDQPALPEAVPFYPPNNQLSTADIANARTSLEKRGIIVHASDILVVNGVVIPLVDQKVLETIVYELYGSGITFCGRTPAEDDYVTIAIAANGIPDPSNPRAVIIDNVNTRPLVVLDGRVDVGEVLNEIRFRESSACAPAR